jgi:chromosomal replication initiation ATPase DnaA
VAYDALFAAWRGEMGGSDPEVAYRRYVEAGLAEPNENPLRRAVHGWLLGSSEFVDRMRSEARQPNYPDEVPASLRLAARDASDVLRAVAEYYIIDPAQFRVSRSREVSRDVAAWFCRRLTACTFRELAPAFGVGHPDSVRNLVRRVDRALATSRKLRHDLARITAILR